MLLATLIPTKIKMIEVFLKKVSIKMKNQSKKIISNKIVWKDINNLFLKITLLKLSLKPNNNHPHV